MTGDPICPDCHAYLSNTYDPNTGRHICISSTNSVLSVGDIRFTTNNIRRNYRTFGRFIVDREACGDLLVDLLILERMAKTREHRARYASKGRQGKRK
jgi:hypothetical protein